MTILEAVPMYSHLRCEKNGHGAVRLSLTVTFFKNIFSTISHKLFL